LPVRLNISRQVQVSAGDPMIHILVLYTKQWLIVGLMQPQLDLDYTGRELVGLEPATIVAVAGVR